MADEVKIDKQAFQDRLLSFVSAWKADKRSNDALFGGVGSIVILMGRNEEAPTFQKKNAMHVCLSSSACFGKAIVDPSVLSVLAAWLRVPRYPYGLYHRSTLHCYNRKERYESYRRCLVLGVC